jgi:transposase InsO family protein
VHVRFGEGARETAGREIGAARVLYSTVRVDLAEAGIEPSVGSMGDSYDNALAETINGLYKAELIHRRAPWKTKESVELATLEWVAWFNNHRLMEPPGYIPPAEAEANYYRQLASHATMPA